MIALMTGGVGCPDENSLVRFSAGQLSGQDLGGIERHLDTCSACRTLIAQLASLGTTEKGTSAEPLAVPAMRHGRVGRYEVERLVGGGGMGMVYAARDKELNRVVAIKLLRTSALANAESRSRLLREAQTMAKLSHPNLVPIFELGSDHGDDFLAMELIDGPTLDVWLRDRKRDWRDVVRVFLEAGRGLEAAHQAGVVHRDFKPGNVLIGPDGRARVTDFGLARPRVPELTAGGEGGSIELTREGSLLGTPAYMSPEQLEGQVADVRSDQFGFCVALTEALAGHRPFSGRSLEELRTRMRSGKPPEFQLEPPRLKKLLLKGLAISPDARFASMGDLLEDLATVLKPSLANGRAVAAAMAFAVVLAAGAGLAWQQMNRPVPAARVEQKSVTLVAGIPQTFALPGVQQITAVDESMLAVAVVGNQQVTLTGLAPGRSTLRMETRSAPHEPRVPVEWTVEVGPAAVEELRLTLGVEETLTIPGLSRIAVGGSDLVEVTQLPGGKALLKPLKPGSTTLLAWRQPGEPRLEWRVTVVAPTEDDGVSQHSLRLFRGSQKVLTIPGIQRVAIGDSAIADVKTIGNDQLLLIGGKPGRTTLIIWTQAAPPADSKRIEYDVRVDAARPVAAEPPERKRFELFVGGQKVLTIPGIQRVAIGDSAIADVKTIGNNQLLVIGAGLGTTTLIVWTSAVPPADSKRFEWDVTVAPPTMEDPDKPKLMVGEQKVLTIPGIERISVGDQAVVEAKRLGADQLLLIAARRGTSAVTVWSAGGKQRQLEVTVDIMKVIPSAQVPPNETQNAETGRRTLTVPLGKQTLLEISGIAKMKVDNSNIVSVHGIGTQQLLVFARGRGTATLEVETRDMPGVKAAHLVWDVTVE